MNLIIAYDIVSDKRRAKIVTELDKVAVRINKSVFLCTDGAISAEQMAEKLNPYIKSEDSVYIVYLCKSCIEKSVYLQAEKNTFRQRKIRII